MLQIPSKKRHGLKENLTQDKQHRSALNQTKENRKEPSSRKYKCGRGVNYGRVIQECKVEAEGFGIFGVEDKGRSQLPKGN